MSWKEILKGDKIEKSVVAFAGGILATIVWTKLNKKLNQIQDEKFKQSAVQRLTEVIRKDPSLVDKMRLMRDKPEIAEIINMVGMPKLEEIAREAQLPQMIDLIGEQGAQSTTSGTQITQMKDLL